MHISLLAVIFKFSNFLSLLGPIKCKFLFIEANCKDRWPTKAEQTNFYHKNLLPFKYEFKYISYCAHDIS
jgi:hypothetical protein